MPRSECSRRKKNDWPWPARRGGTPEGTLDETLAPESGAVLLADATTAPKTSE
jgi:hypothetical protein